MTPLVQHNHTVVANLLARFPMVSANDLLGAFGALAPRLITSCTNTALYGLPLTQDLPAGPLDVVDQYVHPVNIAAALATLSRSAPHFGGQIPLAPELQVYVDAWRPLAELDFDQLVTYGPPVQSAPPPAPIVAAPPAAPIIAPLAAPVAEVAAQDPQEAMRLAMAALAGTAPAAAHAAPPVTTMGELGREGAFANPGHEIVTQEAAPVQETLPVTVPFRSNYKQVAGLPAVDVIAPRTSSAGRPVKSAFERAYKKRESFGKPPYWWTEFAGILPRILTSAPPAAAATDSTAPTTVMSYATVLYVLKLALKEVPADVTAAQLRDWLDEVDARITASPASGAAYDLIDCLFGEGVAPPA